MKRICLLILLPLLLAAKPENAITVLDQDLTTRKAYANYRLHLAFEAKPDARLVVADLLEIDLSSGQVVDVTCEQLDGQPATVAVWRDGTLERPHGVVPGSEGSSQSSSGANRFVASLEQ